MAATEDFGQWSPSPAELRDVDGARARDLLTECFYHAQYQTFARMKQKMGTPWDESAVRRSVSGAIRIALKEVGGSWEQPRRADLMDAAEVLARRARSWGTPADIIVTHQSEFAVVLERMNE
ncbi:MAG: hypothetical protein ACYCXD_03005 [Coriobacteriia bacterium]